MKNIKGGMPSKVIGPDPRALIDRVAQNTGSCGRGCLCQRLDNYKSGILPKLRARKFKDVRWGNGERLVSKLYEVLHIDRHHYECLESLRAESGERPRSRSKLVSTHREFDSRRLTAFRIPSWLTSTVAPIIDTSLALFAIGPGGDAMFDEPGESTDSDSASSSSGRSPVTSRPKLPATRAS